MSIRKILVTAYGILMIVVAIAFIRPLFLGQSAETTESGSKKLVNSEASVFQPLDD